MKQRAKGGKNPPRAESRTVASEGLRIGYDLFPGGDVHRGRADPERVESVMPLVLVHGAGCHRGFWKEHAQLLAGARPVAAVDLPGHGESEAPADVGYTMQRHAAAVADVCRAEGWSRAVFVGHSMGAAVLRRLWIDRREMVAGLGVIDGIFVRDDVAELDLVLAWYDTPKYEKRFAAYVDTLFDARTAKPMREMVRRAMLRCPKHVMLSQIASSYDEDLWLPIDTRTTPVSVLVGGATPLVPNYERRLAREVPALEFRNLGDAGHFLMQERPDEVLCLVRRLLARVATAWLTAG